MLSEDRILHADSIVKSMKRIILKEIEVEKYLEEKIKKEILGNKEIYTFLKSKMMINDFGHFTDEVREYFRFKITRDIKCLSDVDKINVAELLLTCILVKDISPKEEDKEE